MKYLVTILLALISLAVYPQHYPDNDDSITYPNSISDIGVYQTGKVYVETNFNHLADSLFSRMSVQPAGYIKSAVSEALDSLEYYHFNDTLDVFYGAIFNDSANSKYNWLNDNYTLGISSNVDFNANLGFILKATGGYLNTHYNPSNDNKYTINNSSLIFYTPDGYSTFSAIFGSVSGANSISSSPFSPSNSRWAGTLNSASTGYVYNTYRPYKLTVMNRYAANQIKFYRDGSLTSTVSNNSTAIPNLDLYLLTYNNAGSPAAQSANGITFTFWGTGASLSAIQNTKLNEILTRLFNKVNTNQTIYGETSDLYYKIDPYKYTEVFQVICTNGNMQLAYGTDSVFMSINGGVTFPYKSYFAKAEEIEFGHIFDNGKVSIGCRKNIYSSVDSLHTISEVTLKDINGSDYTYHTPSNATYPGSYFAVLQPTHETVLSNDTLLLVGNYTSVLYGASPVQVYRTKDCGVSWKVAYTFGQNTNYRDDGTLDGGTTGTLLGNASNSEVARHIHDVTYMRDSTWFMTTGDGNVNANEVNVFSVKYSKVKDSVYVTKIAQFSTANRFKIVGIHPLGADSVIFATDYPGSESGIYKVKYSEFSDVSKHKKVYNTTSAISGFIKQDNTYIGVENNKNIIIFSKDNGVTWHTVALSGLPTIEGLGVTSGYSNGWFYFHNLPRYHSSSKNLMIKLK